MGAAADSAATTYSVQHTLRPKQDIQSYDVYPDVEYSYIEIDRQERKMTQRRYSAYSNWLGFHQRARRRRRSRR